MNTTEEELNAELSFKEKQIRLWPALVLVVAGILSLRVTQFYEDGPSWLWMVVAFGPLICSIMGLVWWMFFSRVTIRQRTVGMLGIITIGAMTLLLLDPSMFSPVIMMVTLPLGMAGFIVGLYFSKWLPQHRNWLAFTGCLLGFLYSLFFRYEGMWGDYTVRLAPRWQPTSEALLLDRRTSNEEVLPVEQRLQSMKQVSWSGFRGKERRGITNTADLETDWLKHPPQEQWRIEIGPGWSSFAVAGDLLFTQEQRGDDECVTCYDAKSGKEIWIHKDQTRLNDPLGGPGPRATPTLHNGRLYTLGSTGIFLCLDPVNGEILWQVNIPKDVGREVPMWGFCASPLPIGDQLIIHASDSSEQDVFAYRASNGELLWTSSAGEHSYSSPQKMNLDDKQYVAILTDEGLAILAPGNGEVVLNYTWPHRGYRALQPCFIGNNQVLLPTGMGTGTRLIQIDKVADNWNVQEVWTTKNLKPDFNDLLVHQGKIFGFDDSIFTCIDLETGERKWKRGRYGKGQSLLLPEDNLVMVLTEQGAVVVLDADSQTHKELASMQMLNGKTWNHPVFIGDKLYLRNSKEAACYVLPKKDRP